jgi:hypothetical protein
MLYFQFPLPVVFSTGFYVLSLRPFASEKARSEVEHGKSALNGFSLPLARLRSVLFPVDELKLIISAAAND